MEENTREQEENEDNDETDERLPWQEELALVCGFGTQRVVIGYGGNSCWRSYQGKKV